MSEKLRASGGFCLLLLWFAAVNGWWPLLTVLCAAAIHELGHCLTLRLLGARITAFRLTLFGMELQTNSCGISYGRELAAVLAGPAANLLAAVVLNRWGTGEEVSARCVCLICCRYGFWMAVARCCWQQIGRLAWRVESRCSVLWGLLQRWHWLPDWHI